MHVATARGKPRVFIANKHKVMAFYCAVREVDAELFNEALWLPLRAIRRSMVDSVIGSCSAVVPALLSNLLSGQTSMVANGIAVAVPEIHTICGNISNIVADGSALHFVWGNTGSSERGTTRLQCWGQR